MAEQNNLRLRPVRIDDEVQVLAGHRSMEADGFTFALHFESSEPFFGYVDRLTKLARGIDMPAGMVPDTFLLAVVAGVVVGRVSIRHELNEFLAREGGHIGYGVLREHRRRGYGTEILRQSLIIGRSLGLTSALLICADSNAGSAAVIERCGGVLRDRATAADGTAIRRYDIAM